MKSLKIKIASIAAVIFMTQAAQSIIISGNVISTNPGADGTFIKLIPPFTESTPDNTVGDDNFNDENLYGFDEIQNVVAPLGGFTPEIGAPIAAGTVVASHYIFFDPMGGPNEVPQAYEIKGSVLFDADIIGVFTSTASLFATDSLVNPGVNYLNPTNRGLEPGDMVAIDGSNAKQLLITEWNANTPGDYIRILTKRSPGAPNGVPDAGATAMLLGLGLAGLAYARRKLG